jgi:predicted Fe-Mo cluster-binding NifX family protein
MEVIMSYRVAIASTDGKVVNEHFGRAEQFYIVEVSDDGTYQPVELRLLPRVCDGGSHEEGAMRRNAEALAGCRYVLVSRIGHGAENVLEETGITAFEIPDLIEDAVNKLIAYVEINQMIYGG